MADRDLTTEERQQAYEDALQRLADRYQEPPPEEEVQALKELWNPPRPNSVGAPRHQPTTPPPRSVVVKQPKVYGYTMQNGQVRETPRPTARPGYEYSDEEWSAHVSKFTPQQRAEYQQAQRDYRKQFGEWPTYEELKYYNPDTRSIESDPSSRPTSESELEAPPRPPQPLSETEHYQQEQRGFAESYGYQPAPEDWSASRRRFVPPAPARVQSDAPQGRVRMVNGQPMVVQEGPDGQLYMQPHQNPASVPNSPLKPEFQGDRQQMTPYSTTTTQLSRPSDQIHGQDIQPGIVGGVGAPIGPDVSMQEPQMVQGFAPQPGSQALPAQPQYSEAVPGEMAGPESSGAVVPAETMTGDSLLPAAAAPTQPTQPTQPAGFNERFMAEEANKEAARRKFLVDTAAAQQQLEQDRQGYERNLAEFQGRMLQLADETRNLVAMEPDPGRWWNSRSGFQQAALVVGAAAHNVLAVRMGQVPGTNPVLASVERMIEQDIAIQVQNRDSRFKELQAERALVGDAVDLELQNFQAKLARYDALIKHATRIRDNAVEGSTSKQGAMMMIEELEAKKQALSQKMMLQRARVTSRGSVNPTTGTIDSPVVGGIEIKPETIRSYKGENIGRWNTEKSEQKEYNKVLGMARNAYKASERLEHLLFTCGDRDNARLVQRFLPDTVVRLFGGDCTVKIKQAAEQMVNSFRHVEFGATQTNAEAANLADQFTKEDLSAMTMERALGYLQAFRQHMHDRADTVLNTGNATDNNGTRNLSGQDFMPTPPSPEQLLEQRKQAVIQDRKEAKDGIRFKDEVLDYVSVRANGTVPGTNPIQRVERHTNAMAQWAEYLSKLPAESLPLFSLGIQGFDVEKQLSKVNDVLTGLGVMWSTEQISAEQYKQYQARAIAYRKALLKLQQAKK